MTEATHLRAAGALRIIPRQRHLKKHLQPARLDDERRGMLFRHQKAAGLVPTNQVAFEAFARLALRLAAALIPRAFAASGEIVAVLRLGMLTSTSPLP